jgi:acetyl-CoA acetyltransferase
VTAGNASGVNDGACALLLAERGRGRERHGLTPRARVVGMATAGRGAAHHGHRPGAGHAEACWR